MIIYIDLYQYNNDLTQAQGKTFLLIGAQTGGNDSGNSRDFGNNLLKPKGPKGPRALKLELREFIKKNSKYFIESG